MVLGQANGHTKTKTNDETTERQPQYVTSKQTQNEEHMSVAARVRAATAKIKKCGGGGDGWRRQNREKVTVYAQGGVHERGWGEVACWRLVGWRLVGDGWWLVGGWLGGGGVLAQSAVGERRPAGLGVDVGRLVCSKGGFENYVLAASASACPPHPPQALTSRSRRGRSPRVTLRERATHSVSNDTRMRTVQEPPLAHIL